MKEWARRNGIEHAFYGESPLSVCGQVDRSETTTGPAPVSCKVCVDAPRAIDKAAADG